MESVNGDDSVAPSPVSIREMIRQLAAALEGIPCSEAKRCLDVEAKRLTGQPKLGPCATERKRTQFNPNQLCVACRVQYFVEMASRSVR